MLVRNHAEICPRRSSVNLSRSWRRGIVKTEGNARKDKSKVSLSFLEPLISWNGLWVLITIGDIQLGSTSLYIKSTTSERNLAGS